MGFFGKLRSIFSRKKPKLGLALGSGGAKGMVHLGALKAFEEAGIRFSVVAGSSIGSIVGALYAKGYSWHDMVQIVENLNRKEFAKNLRPFSDMGFAETFLETYLEGDISSLPMPYAACATDGATNELVVLDSGKIARALTASSAFPPFFRGVEIGERRLYDGAFTDAVPADICRQLGADFVVGIDLSAVPKPEEEKSRLSRFFGAAMAKMTPVRETEDAHSRGYEAADLMLMPDLHDYRATDVARGSMDKMFEIGYETAVANLEELKKKIGKWRRKR